MKPIRLLVCCSAFCLPRRRTLPKIHRASASVLEVYPPLGTKTDLGGTDRFKSGVFEFGATNVDFGDGIFVESVDVDDGFGIRVRIVIEADAELGFRTVDVDTNSRGFELGDSFEVISQSFSVTPATARIGETLSVDVLGNNTEWVGGVTWPSFGDGIEVNDFTVLSDTLAVADVSVSTETAPGWRNIVMDNGGGDRVTLYDGFKVDRVALAASFEPTLAEQGDTSGYGSGARYRFHGRSSIVDLL